MKPVPNSSFRLPNAKERASSFSIRSETSTDGKAAIRKSVFKIMSARDTYSTLCFSEEGNSI
jgi:hypothetical protein